MTQFMTKKGKVLNTILGALSLATLTLGTSASAGDYYAPSSYAPTTAYASSALPSAALPSNEIVGAPYTVAGLTYTPQHQPNYDQVGQASWYGDRFHGKLTASGETFDKNAMTAAHKTLPINSKVRVTNMATGQSVVVRINDRGPFVGNGVIDLSEAAALKLGYAHTAPGAVRVTYIKPAKAAYNVPVQPAPRYATPTAPYNMSGSMMPQTVLPTAPIAIPTPSVPQTSQTTLTIKGQVHMATSRTTDAQPKFIRAVNRVTHVTQN